MMDIERMKKVNELTKELQKHGIASSSDDAAVKAEEYLKLREKIVPETPQQVVAVASVARDELNTQIEQIKRVINNLANDMQSMKMEMSQLAKNVLSHSTSINSIKDNASRNSPSQQTITVQPATRVDPAPVQQQQQSSPRSGNFKPEDVAIDKFFYFGKK